MDLAGRHRTGAPERMSLFWTAFGLIFISELADKSRIAALLLVAAFRRPWPVFAGMTAGYALLEGLSVTVGWAAAPFLPQRALSLLVGAAFVLMGAAAFLVSEENHEKAVAWLERRKSGNAFWVAFGVTSIAEIADRTQITAAALSAETLRPLIVYAGAMTALTLLNAVTVRLGADLIRRVPLKTLRWAGGILFIAAGIGWLAGAARG